MVSNTSALLPEPDTPVNTVSRRFGISTLMSLRLFTRAPCTRIRSWLTAWRAGDFVSVLVALLIVRSSEGSAELGDADLVARGIAEGAVPKAVWLLDWLLDDLGTAGLQPLEGTVEVGGGQNDPGVAALRHHLDDRAALIVGDPGGGGRRIQVDRRAGLVGGADCDP